MTRRAPGFTLIEVIVSLALLAVGLALAFGTLRGATRATERSETTAARTERLRAVQGFMRAQITQALPIAYDVEPSTGEASYVHGERDKVEFVGAMPGYLSRGGPYLQTFELRRGGQGLQLVYSFRLLTTEGALDPEREPQVLLDGISDGRFEFRTIDAAGKAGDWQGDWKARGQIPPLLRLSLRFDDARRRWPDFVVPLRLGTGYIGTGQASTPANGGGR
jgi:general secretion pathway protein J